MFNSIDSSTVCEENPGVIEWGLAYSILPLPISEFGKGSNIILHMRIFVNGRA